jgi:hypothetical protein
MVAEDEGVSESISWSHLSAWHKWGGAFETLARTGLMSLFFCACLVVAY